MADYRGLTPDQLYRRTAWLTTAGALAVIALACAIGTRQIAVLLADLPAERVDAVNGLITAYAAGAAALIVAGMFAAARSLRGRLASTVNALTDVAERVAAGNLAVEFTPSASRGSYGRLSRAVAGMLAELRRLTGEIAASARDTERMGTEITTATEQMSASAGEIAETSNVLSQQSTEMAGAIQALHADNARLLGVAAGLRSGAQDGLERSATVRELRAANRARHDENASDLATLAADVKSSVAAVEGVAAASEEIRAFVALVQKMARQSKLLALNAAMEAARAGESGQGFGVVASEVRRLAASSADAAARAAMLVNDVLARVAESRATSAQTVRTVDAVLERADANTRTLAAVSAALDVADEWTGSIAEAAALSHELVEAMTREVDKLAHGTESFAAAMQQVAASSEQQSASSHEIAGTAAALTAHAQRLGRLARAFDTSTEPPLPAHVAPAPAPTHRARGPHRRPSAIPEAYAAD